VDASLYLEPLIQLPVEWLALALLVVACLFWERSGLSGLGVEGCAASAWLGLFLGYEATGQIAVAVLAALGLALLFALATGALVQLSRVDPAVGTFLASLVPWSALVLLLRSRAPLLATQSRPRAHTGTRERHAAGCSSIQSSGWRRSSSSGRRHLANTPFGLRLRAFGGIPDGGFPARRRRRTGWSRGLGGAFAAPAVPARADMPPAPPAALGIWRSRVRSPPAGPSFRCVPRAGPALRAALVDSRPEWGIVLDLAPFLLALVY
jgi:hypothetical protein